MGKKYIYTDEDDQVVRGDCECGQEVVVLDDGQWHHPSLFKHYIKKIIKKDY